MPKLRRLSGKALIALLESKGFQVVKVTGSHHKLQRVIDDQKQTLLIPVHGSKDVNVKTLRSIYRQASAYLSEAELQSLFYTD